MRITRFNLLPFLLILTLIIIGTVAFGQAPNKFDRTEEELNHIPPLPDSTIKFEDDFISHPGLPFTYRFTEKWEDRDGFFTIEIGNLSGIDTVWFLSRSLQDWEVYKDETNGVSKGDYILISRDSYYNDKDYVNARTGGPMSEWIFEFKGYDGKEYWLWIDRVGNTFQIRVYSPNPSAKPSFPVMEGGEWG